MLRFLFLGPLSIASALSWNSSPSNGRLQPADFVENKRIQPANIPRSTSHADLGLDPDDFNAIFRNIDVAEYARQPDCFRSAAGHIRTRCGELEMNEGGRVRAAISMTLCELRTAQHYSPPLECAAFSPDAGNDLLYDAPYAGCVEAFSRSAQFWASYSGYLREIPQFCFAFQRWNDIDIAQELYKNATLEKIAFIRFMSSENKRNEDSRLHWQAFISETQNILSNLQASAHGVVDKVSATIVEQSRNGLHKILADFQLLLSQLQQHSRDDMAQVISNVDSAISSIEQTHSNNLLALETTFEQSLTSQLKAIFGRMDETFIHLLTLTAILQLSQSASDTSSQLEANNRLARQAQQTQRDISRSTIKLSEAMKHMTATTHEEMRKINDTATMLKTSLTENPDRGGGLGLVGNAFRAIFSVSQSSVDPVAPQHFHLHPIIQLCLVFSRLFWFLLQGMVSSPTTMFIFISAFCLRKLTFRVFAPRATTAFQGRHQHCCLPRTTFVHSFSRNGAQGARPSWSTATANRRFSRIPDRLCNPTSDALAWG
ncbi:hypothetical protein EW146_g3479 [Bondarzewia mesenterica]|uniref:Nuclear fusion protein KAR5 n=1 Tax=Bondarzewia mesenterica TaxID=1095465 RepID=A0A4V3XFF7_9AGAM|nr:hypothetical protein EW146_g3479 [Bondarzewia mesenterica]